MVDLSRRVDSPAAGTTACATDADVSTGHVAVASSRAIPLDEIARA
jgi:hypothetical protein